MKPNYDHVISQLATQLFVALVELNPNPQEILAELERLIAGVLRQVGLQVVGMVFNQLCQSLTEEAKAQGMVVHRRIQVKYAVLFGQLEIESPYLWNRQTRRGCRPVKEQLGIEPGGRSPALQRALTDFGIEESFGQAAKRFEEHYGWEIDRATIRREVEQVAQLAEQYVDIRLLEAFLNYSQPHTVLPDDERVLVELDGCHIRTAQKPEETPMFRPTHNLVALTTGQKTPVALVRSQQPEKGWYQVKTALDWFSGESIIMYHEQQGLYSRGVSLVNYTLEKLK
jgi:hypothetical protein